MAKTMIEVHNLSKKYFIGQLDTYRTLRESLIGLFCNRQKKLNEEFWALRGINLNVKEGEILGVIGKNGAGKSTLLKVLTQVTPPTTGKIKIYGRVGSLLEVGTGFHPELSGRENIYLNGAILGMKRSEIKKRFNEIVAFSEIEKFIDTPVKRYSSGMYVRLAFAVAAHLDPEILLVDEVLAVGDVAFQKKCLGKMSEVAKGGRTIIFVSHNMAAINELCQKCVLLDKGKIISLGQTNKVIEKYLSRQYHHSEGIADLKNTKIERKTTENSIFKFQRLTMLNSHQKSSARLALGESFSIEIKGYLSEPIDDLKVAFSIDSSMGFAIFNSFNKDNGLPIKYNKGEVTFLIRLDSNILAPGVYSFSLGGIGTNALDWIPEALTFCVEQVSLEGKNVDPEHGGILVYPCKWSLKKAK